MSLFATRFHAEILLGLFFEPEGDNCPHINIIDAVNQRLSADVG
jgi:hypothetical protein